MSLEAFQAVANGIATREDRATICAKYIRHRMPGISEKDAKEAAFLALDWAGENPLKEHKE